MTSILSQFETKVIFSRKFSMAFFYQLLLKNGIPRWCIGNLPMQETGSFDSWVRKIPWRRKWQPTLAFLPGKSCRQKSLVGYSSCSHKRVIHDSSTKQQVNFVLSLFLIELYAQQIPSKCFILFLVLLFMFQYFGMRGYNSKTWLPAPEM